MFDADEAAHLVILDAVERTRAFGAGRGDTAVEIRKRFEAARASRAATTPAGVAAARSVAQAASVAHMGAHALGAAAYAVKAVALAHPDQSEAVPAEILWQLGQLDDQQRNALRELPLLGTNASGPLGPGLLCNGILGTTIRHIQADIG